MSRGAWDFVMAVAIALFLGTLFTPPFKVHIAILMLFAFLLFCFYMFNFILIRHTSLIGTETRPRPVDTSVTFGD